MVINLTLINPLASPSAGAPALKYGDVNTVTPSPGEVKGLTIIYLKIILYVRKRRASTPKFYMIFE